MKSKNDFCHIASISNRQVLAYTTHTDEETALIIKFRVNGAELDTKICFNTKGKLDAAFAKFMHGKLDRDIEKQIAQAEELLAVEEDQTP